MPNKTINLTALRCAPCGKLWRRYVSKGVEYEVDFFVAYTYAFRHLR